MGNEFCKECCASRCEDDKIQGQKVQQKSPQNQSQPTEYTSSVIVNDKNQNYNLKWFTSVLSSKEVASPIKILDTDVEKRGWRDEGNGQASHPFLNNNRGFQQQDPRQPEFGLDIKYKTDPSQRMGQSPEKLNNEQIRDRIINDNFNPNGGFETERRSRKVLAPSSLTDRSENEQEYPPTKHEQPEAKTHRERIQGHKRASSPWRTIFDQAKQVSNVAALKAFDTFKKSMTHQNQSDLKYEDEGSGNMMQKAASNSELSYFEYQEDVDDDHNENLEIASVSEVYKDAIDVVKKQFNDREEKVLNQLTLRTLKKKPQEVQENQMTEDEEKCMENDQMVQVKQQYQQVPHLEFGLKSTDLFVQEYDQADCSNYDRQEFDQFVQRFGSSINGSLSNAERSDRQAMPKSELNTESLTDQYNFSPHQNNNAHFDGLLKAKTGQNSFAKAEDANNMPMTKMKPKQQESQNNDMEKYKLFSCSSSAEEKEQRLRSKIRSGLNEQLMSIQKTNSSNLHSSSSISDYAKTYLQNAKKIQRESVQTRNSNFSSTQSKKKNSLKTSNAPSGNMRAPKAPRTSHLQNSGVKTRSNMEVTKSGRKITSRNGKDGSNAIIKLN